MKQYEMTFLTREEIKGAEPILKEIEALEGKIISTSTIGEKTLAYPVKKEKSAFFTTAIFEITPEKLPDLNRKLALKDDILRHLIIVYKEIKLAPVKERKLKPVEIKKPVFAPEEPEISEIPTFEKPRPEEQEVKEIKKVEEPKVKPAPEIKEEKKDLPAKPKVTPKKEIPEAGVSEEERLKALDKKLDELLKE